jgi:TonB family protein
MMPILALVLVATAPEAAQTSPTPAKPLNSPMFWVTANDYPAEATRELAQGTTAFRLTIDSEGKVANCEIVESSKVPLLDTQTCSLILQRARFAPATDDTGKPVQGSYRNRVTWRIPETSAKLPMIEASIPPATLPTGPTGNSNNLRRPEAPLDNPLRVRLVASGPIAYVIDIDSDGRISQCSITTASIDADVANETCRHLTAQKMNPARNIDDQPTPSKYKGTLKWRESGMTVLAGRPLPNRFATSEVRTSFTLGADGVIANCKMAVTGANPYANNVWGMCGLGRAFEPFRDAQGNAVARDVILTMGVDVKDSTGGRSNTDPATKDE